jgi:hypothetical protein
MAAPWLPHGVPLQITRQNLDEEDRANNMPGINCVSRHVIVHDGHAFDADLTEYH